MITLPHCILCPLWFQCRKHGQKGRSREQEEVKEEEQEAEEEQEEEEEEEEEEEKEEEEKEGEEEEEEEDEEQEEEEEKEGMKPVYVQSSQQEYTSDYQDTETVITLIWKTVTSIIINFANTEEPIYGCHLWDATNWVLYRGGLLIELEMMMNIITKYMQNKTIGRLSKRLTKMHA